MNTAISETPVPNWAFDTLGKLVALTEDCEVYPGDWVRKGARGVLLSVSTKRRWGRPGAYATVAFNLRDMSYEENVELHQLEPVQE
jgi:hypothetical protein